MRYGWMGFVGLLGAFCACVDAGGDGASPTSTASGAGGAAASSGSTSSGGLGAPTYYEDVAPILVKHCGGCHASGSIAPFPLETYEDAASIADLLVKTTASRTMPPFRADNSGACNTFADARWLSDAELGTIADWATGGVLQGDPANAPPKPKPELGLANVGATLDMGLSYTPPIDAPDDYRCFLVDPKLASTKYLTGFDVVPGDPRVVHHVVVFVPTDDQAVADAEALDAMDATPGWSCFGGADVNANLSVAWAPGVPATHFPAGTGLEIPAGRKVILQMHYNVSQGSFPDRTRVDLELAGAVDHVAHIEPLVDFNLLLAPKLADASTSFTTIVDRKRVVYGAFPHEHKLGKTMRFERTSLAKETSCVLDVPKWDFNWQLFYFYEKPLEFLPGDQLNLACHYDTTTQNASVAWGEGTSDEMCVMLLYVTTEGPACNHCGPELEGNAWPPTDLCPGSDGLFASMKACVCDTHCTSECGPTLCSGFGMSSECQACVDASCAAEAKACFNDHNSLGGP